MLSGSYGAGFVEGVLNFLDIEADEMADLHVGNLALGLHLA